MARQKIVRAIFAAAHSQDDFLKALAEDTEIDFTRITGFHMDEYMGLGKDASQNFGNFLRKAIFPENLSMKLIIYSPMQLILVPNVNGMKAY